MQTGVEVRAMASEQKTYRVVRRFEVTVEKSGEENGVSMGKHYEVRCGELTGCTVRAGTESEALRRMIHAIGIWLDLADRQLYDEVLYFDEQIDFRLRAMGLTSDELAEGNGNKKTRKPVVQVTWLDPARREDGIRGEQVAASEPARVVSFGVLMAEHDGRLTLNSHVATQLSGWGENQTDYSGTVIIPRQSVVGLEVLGEVEVG